jgi:acyl-CoA thioester hydrolase
MSYSKQYEVRWADLDANGHMRMTSYAEYALEVRFRYLWEHGFSPARLYALGIGPVALTEENRYLKEVRMGDTITITLRGASTSADGSRWTVEHEVITSKGDKAAMLRVVGAWLDLKSRKPVAPPADVLELFERFSEVESQAAG